ncbi:MAG: hypothetical protein FWF06_03140 [Symbiobacteriaceae bacterium]|nr:hypothetical protein [Symbiobacteriaceae bacterium]
MSKTATTVAADLCLKWEEGLSTLQQSYSEIVFPGVVAFLGMSCLGWSTWLSSCAEVGIPCKPSEITFRATASEIHTLPWFCLFNPLDQDSSWIMVKGSGLSPSQEMLAPFMHPHMSQTLASMNTNLQPIISGESHDTLRRLGLIQQTNRQGELPKVYLPLTTCRELAKSWDLLQQQSSPVVALLQEYAAYLVEQEQDWEQLKESYWEVMAAAWDLLQQKKIIRCSPFPGESWRTMWGLFVRPTGFNGLMVILGDHHTLWRQVAADMGIPY